MSSVRSTSLLGGLVHLDMLDDEVSSIKAFDIGIGFGVLEKSEKEFSRFDWVAGP